MTKLITQYVDSDGFFLVSERGFRPVRITDPSLSTFDYPGRVVSIHSDGQVKIDIQGRVPGHGKYLTQIARPDQFRFTD